MRPKVPWCGPGSWMVALGIASCLILGLRATLYGCTPCFNLRPPPSRGDLAEFLAALEELRSLTQQSIRDSTFQVTFDCMTGFFDFLLRNDFAWPCAFGWFARGTSNSAPYFDSSSCSMTGFLLGASIVVSSCFDFRVVSADCLFSKPSGKALLASLTSVFLASWIAFRGSYFCRFFKFSLLFCLLAFDSASSSDPCSSTFLEVCGRFLCF